MIPKFSKEELRRILGPARRELTGDEYEEVRLILKLLDPVEFGNSLHCWSETYRYNGKIYELTGELAHPMLLPTIVELDPEDFSDK